MTTPIPICAAPAMSRQGWIVNLVTAAVRSGYAEARRQVQATN